MNTRKELEEKKKKVDKACFKLLRLAEAFGRTGNFVVSEEISELSDIISTSAEDMLKAYDKETGENFDATMKQIGKTLSACVAASE